MGQSQITSKRNLGMAVTQFGGLVGTALLTLATLCLGCTGGETAHPGSDAQSEMARRDADARQDPTGPARGDQQGESGGDRPGESGAVGSLPAARSLPTESSGAILEFSGGCDASAAVALDATRFVVADDERNILRIYRNDRGGTPEQVFPCDEMLGIDPMRDEHPEADIEGAADFGDRVFWITSHGRSKDGKWRPNRHRFFATEFIRAGQQFALKPVGTAYTDLVADLLADPQMRPLGLSEAVGTPGKKDARLAPKVQGINIEGLCATAGGDALWIGFRNPRPGGRAIIVPLLNPVAVVAQQVRPRFGRPILLRLAAESEAAAPLGIRSMEYSKRHKAYFIVAGAHDQRKLSAVYRWSGSSDDPPRLLPLASRLVGRLGDFSPEALLFFPETDRILLVSDDGSLKVKVDSAAACLPGTFDNGWCEAKSLLDDSRKTFRALWVDAE